MLDLGGVRDRAELSRRLAVTAAALIVYRVGTQVPMPGLDPQTLSQFAGVAGVMKRISIFALGVTPLLTVVILAELAKVIVPRLRQWERADPNNRDKLNRIVLLLAFLVAAAQAFGIAVGLENVRGLVDEPGAGFRLTCVATLVAGTMATIWLADQITRHGLGSGLWLVLVTPMLADVIYRVGALVAWQSQGTVSSLGLLLCCAFLVLALATLVALVRAGHGAPEVALTCLWSTLVCYMALPWLLVTLSELAGGRGSIEAWIAPNGPAYFFALAGLITLFVPLYLRSLGEVGAAASLSVPPLVIGAALIAVVLLSDVLPADFRLLLPLQGQVLIVTAIVALGILERWWQAPFDAAARGEPRKEQA